MIEITFKTTGGLIFEIDPTGQGTVISLPDGSCLRDLETWITSRGVDPASKKYLVIFNGLGIRQWSPDERLKTGDTLLVIPPLMGG